MTQPETRQQVLVIHTAPPSGPIGLRAEAIGWSAEDGREAAPYARTDRHVGLMGYFRGPYSYPTPYHALGDGWRLLAPPTEYQDPGYERPCLEWWLVRDAALPIGDAGKGST